MKEFFKFIHVTTFEESNLVGNVYFTNYLKWQGRCRELFLMEEAPTLLDELYPKGSIALVTTSCSCQFYGELLPMQRIEIHMRLSAKTWNRIGMTFRYLDHCGNLVAEGAQEVICKRRLPGGALGDIDGIPSALSAALSRYKLAP